MPAPAAANRAGANVGPKYHTKSAGAAPRTPLLMYAYSPKFEQAPCGTFPSLPGSTPRFDFEKTALFGVCLPSLDILGGPHLRYKGEHRNPGRMGWIGVSALQLSDRLQLQCQLQQQPIAQVPMWDQNIIQNRPGLRPDPAFNVCLLP